MLGTGTRRVLDSEGELRAQHQQWMPAALELSSFLINLRVTLKEELFPLPLAECSHHRENMPALCPPGWAVKVNELEFVKCFEIVDESPTKSKAFG